MESTALNSPDSEFDPTISNDGSIIVFASARPGGAGALDLYESVGAAGQFAAPVRIASRMTMTRDRGGTAAIYETSR